MKSASSRNRLTTARWVRLGGMVAFVCLVACCAILSALPARANPPQSSAAPSQSQISAAFIFNFAKFTEWPPAAFSDPATPLTVCFLGADDVRSAFQSISAGKALNGRSVQVREVKPTGDVHDCQIVYIDSPNAALLAAVMKNARQCSALVIGSSDDFLARGGMIKLSVERNRMRFDVNVGATGRIKIHLSSKLLALARSVVDLPDPAGN
jgi:YfiR/HmsC-like